MPEVSIEVEVYCSCGSGLCRQSIGSSKRPNIPCIIAEPCEKCLGKAEDKGYDAGYLACEKNQQGEE